MFGLFAGCLGAFWLQFCHNLARTAETNAAPPPPPEQSAADQAQVDRILARCAAADEAAAAHSPGIVARWVEFVHQHDLPIVVISRNQAIVPSLTPAPRRVH